MSNKINYLLFAVVVILVFMCYNKYKYDSDDECMDDYDEEKEHFKISTPPKMMPTITTTKTTYNTKDTRSQPTQNIKPVPQPKGAISKNLPFRIY